MLILKKKAADDKRALKITQNAKTYLGALSAIIYSLMIT